MIWYSISEELNPQHYHCENFKYCTVQNSLLVGIDLWLRIIVCTFPLLPILIISE